MCCFWIVVSMKPLRCIRKSTTICPLQRNPLKNANWDVVEFQTLIQQNLKQPYDEELNYLNPVMVTPQVLMTVKGSVQGMATKVKAYLRNLFKKRRTAASRACVNAV